MKEALSDDASPRNRAFVLNDLRRAAWCDVLVRGCGVVAATITQACALHGLRTVLASSEDFVAPPWDSFGFASESPSHVPLWSRVIFDLPRRSALRDLRRVVPHLVRDGTGGAVINWCRLTVERVLAASAEGALCLNYVGLHSVPDTGTGGKTRIEIQDHVAGGKLPVIAGVVLDVQEWCSVTRPRVHVARLYSEEPYAAQYFTARTAAELRARAGRIGPGPWGIFAEFRADKRIDVEHLLHALKGSADDYIRRLARGCYRSELSSVGSYPWPMRISVGARRGEPVWQIGCEEPLFAEWVSFRVARRLLLHAERAVPLARLKGRVLPGGARFHEVFRALSPGMSPYVEAAAYRYGGKIERILEALGSPPTQRSDDEFLQAEEVYSSTEEMWGRKEDGARLRMQRTLGPGECLELVQRQFRQPLDGGNHP